MRTSKTVTDGINTLTCKFIYDGNTLIAEQRDNEWIYYLYGVDGIAGFRYDGETYLYRKNIQGDITHVYRKDEEKLVQVAHYAYDAYGNTKELQENSAISKLNPFRYRGYYFDSETGLYYLISRYYDPETGRFISSDSIEYLDPETLGGLNLYAYCNNNPVINIDPNGKIFLTILGIFATLAIGSLIGGFSGGIAAVTSGGDFWAGFAGGALSGLISTIGITLAVTTGGFGGLAIAGIFGFAAGFSGSVVQQGIEKGWNNIDFHSAAISGGISMAMNMICYGLTNFMMRESVGLFEHIFDKSLKFLPRFISALSLTPEALVPVLFCTIPITVCQTLLEIIKGYYEKLGSRVNATI